MMGGLDGRQNGPTASVVFANDERAVNGTNDDWQQLPADLRRAAEAALSPGEPPLSWVELDLDTTLHYARGLLVLTPQRLLDISSPHRSDTPCADSRADDGTRSVPPTFSVRSWPLQAATGLRARDQTGTGRLELLGPAGLLCTWRYTIGRSHAAHRLADRFERLRQGELSGGEEPAEPPTVICPSCGAVLAADQGDLPGLRHRQRQAGPRHAAAADRLRQDRGNGRSCWDSR